MPLNTRHLALAGFVVAASSLSAAPDWKQVESMLAAKCYECHNADKMKGDIDLKQFAANPDVPVNFKLWSDVKDTIDNGDMPPRKAKQLTSEEKAGITGWVQHNLDVLAEAKSGDPGPVTMRRLTNAEYDNTLRDLTGRDYALAKEFQTDGGGGEGFTNTGDVLFMSPAAIDKYFGAARKLADHATIMPGTGIVFHPQRIGLRGPEQVKAQAQQGLYVWYQQKAALHLPKDFDPMREGDYMLACWKHKNAKTPLDQLAKDMKLSIHFLSNWWNLVNSTEPKSRYLDLVRVPWRELPADEKTAHERIKAIEADLLSWNNPKKPGSGVQRQQQDSDGIRPYVMQGPVNGKTQVHLCFGDTGDGNKGDIALVTQIDYHIGKQKLNYLTWLDKALAEKRQQVAANPPPPNLDAIKARLAELEKTRALYGKHPQPGRSIEPNVLAFAAPQVVTLPLPEGANWLLAHARLDMQNPEVDEATIQWTMTTGTPRDVTKIIPGVLTIWKRSTKKSGETMNDFNKMKTAFPDMFERRLEEVANNLYRGGKPNITVYYFSDDQLGQLLGQQDKDTLAAMKKDWGYNATPNLNKQQQQEYDGALLWHLHEFAKKAWRRPLAEDETKKLDALYFASRAKELDRESAAREVLVRVLVSPNFLFKAETLPPIADAKTTEVPLNAHELASRLSYFLWASLPDWQLRKAADDGSLLKPEVLAEHTKRMLRDPKATALAKEYAGQWLKFNGFDEKSTVDEKKFPQFTPELRADMQREAVEFFAHLVRDDRSVSDIISGDYTFLNERLAKHYGIPDVTGGDFREVKGIAQHHRGGLLGMAAILTKTSRPNRTSPVVRGDYLYQVVLGIASPPPPPNVPELKETSKPSSLREALMQHRTDSACAVCHERIDPLGFALESFDPIGRFRATDDTGGKIDDTGEMTDGSKFTGFTGLRDYLKKNESQFLTQLTRKLLGYALGRQTLPSDKKLLQQMQASLKAQNGHFSAAVLEIVKSRQFLNRRAEPQVAGNP
ncbi:MAG: DUF1592 domain-containing protein [Prosthecobacter sp.]|jgi:hypothetical protein|uniref:DUF1592 domain-containing protein n=1 Tax=Prosthecobacter sp. TaxID=1965333 RepID=UPI0019FA4C67|nr:DUF1592 domain-containing protein [Prosthecobacter sp.]MBE2287846.1 DUF1592 domain-containing protein [Prosthecobacter sp.]